MARMRSPRPLSPSRSCAGCRFTRRWRAGDGRLRPPPGPDPRGPHHPAPAPVGRPPAVARAPAATRERGRLLRPPLGRGGAPVSGVIRVGDRWGVATPTGLHQGVVTGILLKCGETLSAVAREDFAKVELVTI